MQQDSLISERDYLKAQVRVGEGLRAGLPHVLSVQVSSQDEAVRGLEAILQGERTKVCTVGEGVFFATCWACMC